MLSISICICVLNKFYSKFYHIYIYIYLQVNTYKKYTCNHCEYLLHQLQHPILEEHLLAENQAEQEGKHQQQEYGDQNHNQPLEALDKSIKTINNECNKRVD